MKQQRLALLNEIDKQAQTLAIKFIEGKSITEDILKTIIELYSSAQIERELSDAYFETAYHTPVTGELEFYIARTIFHFSKIQDLGWKILLRKQENKVAPDIRILKNGETISIIEIKAKGGWIQPFLSPERYEKDKHKFDNGHSYNPDDLVQKFRSQLSKYTEKFNLTKNDIYFFLPTLALVHRKKYKSNLSDYYNYFSITSELPKENFIILSENLRLDLAHKPDIQALNSTNNFERMLQSLSSK